jgi:aromatic ring-opening dioxygenase catalytic subunit (LigB family)
MADVVGIYAATHTPVLLNFPDLVTPAERDQLFSGFKTLGARIAEASAESLVVLSNDHLHNFFLDNLPALCIGAADRYEAPVEPWLAAEKRELKGDGELGAYLLGEALESGFDPAFSMELVLDHGTLTPLELTGFGSDTPIVPILVNCVQPPLPTMRRCVEFGRFLGRALRAYDGCRRVAILATGGLSHDVGTPRMGMVNEEFDREFLRLLNAAHDEQLLDYAKSRVNEAGNGTEEIRNWLIAYGAANGASLDVITYRSMPAWYIGACLVEWISTTDREGET